MKTIEINSLVLAYYGDSIYENYVRHYLILQNIATIKELQQKAVFYVSATAQVSFLQKLLDKHYFNEEELDVLRRARNAKGHAHPKGCTMVTYKKATALEALIGYLQLEGKKARVLEIMKEIMEG